jgi:hypothetical protein
MAPSSLLPEFELKKTFRSGSKNNVSWLFEFQLATWRGRGVMATHAT